MLVAQLSDAPVVVFPTVAQGFPEAACSSVKIVYWMTIFSLGKPSARVYLQNCAQLRGEIIQPCLFRLYTRSDALFTVG